MKNNKRLKEISPIDYMENLKEYNQLLMNKKNLKKLSKSQLIDKLLKLEESIKKPDVIIVDDTKPTPAPRSRRPIPMPRLKKSVKSLVNAYEKNYYFTSNSIQR